MSAPNPVRDLDFENLFERCDGFAGVTGDVVAIALAQKPSDPPWQYATLRKQLEGALLSEEAGEFFEHFTIQDVYWCLFDCVKLERALAILKSALEQLEILDGARILHASIGDRLFEIHWPEHSSASAAALDNVDVEFQAQLEKFLGLKTVCVALAAGPGSTVWQDPDIARSLDDVLQARNAGRFDGFVISNNRYFLFFHCPDMAVAVQTLKAALNERELLNHAQILVAEPSEKKFQIYHPSAAGGELV